MATRTTVRKTARTTVQATAQTAGQTDDRKPAAASRSPHLRFQATLGSTPHAKAVAAVAGLDLDRLPDADGRVTLLISADDARRLLDQGFEVHLKAAVPLAPLAPALILSDAQAQTWLEQQVKGIVRKGDQ